MLLVFSLILATFGPMGNESLVKVALAQRPSNDIDIRMVSLNHQDFDNTGISHFRFLVAGHIYGSHAADAPRPASTFSNNLPFFQSLDLSMIVLLGDIVWESNEENFDALERNFLSQVTFPIFNAVGNHDLGGNRALYEQHFGPTFFTFQYGSALMIFLDTELSGCSIVGEQRNMLEASLHQARQNEVIHHIFIFMHKVMFADSETLQAIGDPLFLPNDPKACHTSNYSELYAELLLPMAQVKPIYLMAGDVGAWGGNLSPFFQQDPNLHLVTVATGIGDTPKDSVILVTINDAEANFEVLSLTGQPADQIEAYGRTYWETRYWEAHTKKETASLVKIAYIVGGISLVTLSVLAVIARHRAINAKKQRESHLFRP